MSVFSWPDGWRLPGRLPREPRPVEVPLPAARAMTNHDYVDVYYTGPWAGRRACVACEVTWHGDRSCFVCGGPGEPPP